MNAKRRMWPRSTWPLKRGPVPMESGTLPPSPPPPARLGPLSLPSDPLVPIFFFILWIFDGVVSRIKSGLRVNEVDYLESKGIARGSL